MQTIESIEAMRHQVGAWRSEGLRVGLVPTLGNLHAGHQALVEHCSQIAERTVVSIFVNPTQFGAGEDFERYPRTLDADRDKLARAGAQTIFAPSVDEVYPGGAEHTTVVQVPKLSDILCGAARPGHFRGVTTVVSRLFNMTQPDLAVFGQKDWQQLLVIRRMARDLAFPVEIVGVPTIREADGLALSSRNSYLSADQRVLASRLHGALRDTAAAIANGRRDFESLESEATHSLSESGFKPDYVAIRAADTLALPEPSAAPSSLRVLAAAWLGPARLIDNVGVG